MFDDLDQELQKELIAFCKAEESDRTPKPLNVTLIAEILRQIVRNERKITGFLTNQDTGDVFVRFSFTD